ncbi:hypothetical protein K1719_020723 [Acacia pycnantha]|nr:hypothetical protein K1719_020723 [Acacia pycnantha]
MSCPMYHLLLLHAGSSTHTIFSFGALLQRCSFPVGVGPSDSIVSVAILGPRCYWHLREVEGILPNTRRLEARNCESLSLESKSIILSEELHGAPGRYNYNSEEGAYRTEQVDTKMEEKEVAASKKRGLMGDDNFAFSSAAFICTKRARNSPINQDDNDAITPQVSFVKALEIINNNLGLKILIEDRNNHGKRTTTNVDYKIFRNFYQYISCHIRVQLLMWSWFMLCFG